MLCCPLASFHASLSIPALYWPWGCQIIFLTSSTSIVVTTRSPSSSNESPFQVSSMAWMKFPKRSSALESFVCPQYLHQSASGWSTGEGPLELHLVQFHVKRTASISTSRDCGITFWTSLALHSEAHQELISSGLACGPRDCHPPEDDSLKNHKI